LIAWRALRPASAAWAVVRLSIPVQTTVEEAQESLPAVARVVWRTSLYRKGRAVPELERVEVAGTADRPGHPSQEWRVRPIIGPRRWRLE